MRVLSVVAIGDGRLGNRGEKTVKAVGVIKAGVMGFIALAAEQALGRPFPQFFLDVAAR